MTDKLVFDGKNIEITSDQWCSSDGGHQIATAVTLSEI